MKESDVPRALAIDAASFIASDLRLDTREERLRGELARSYARLRVARSHSSGEAIGYVLFWHVTDEIHLLNVAVDPQARRQGVGRALTNEVIGYARTNECAKILLEVRRGNSAAIRLYESLGFSEFNVRARYYSDGEDGVEMMLTAPFS
jgi:[ribosomal protein S18]-alanine N-acetyltransferase